MLEEFEGSTSSVMVLPVSVSSKVSMPPLRHITRRRVDPPWVLWSDRVRAVRAGR